MSPPGEPTEPPTGPFVYERLAGRVVFGAGSIERLGDEADRLEAHRVVIVGSRSAGGAVEAAGRLLGSRVAAVVPRARKHVPEEDARAVRSLAAGHDADCVVAIGGGSAIGLAKAAVLEHDAAIVAVPTTYSGSEMTPIYGITAGARKRTGRSARVRPSVVIYDPELTTGLPARVSAASAMNALAHCIEALYAPAADPVARLLAREGLKVLVESMPAVVASPGDVSARGRALYGAFLAGSALESTTMGLHHRICHVLGGTFGLPHAGANSAVLPHVVAYNAGAAPEAMAAIASVLDGADAARAVYDFARSVDAPAALRELGFDEACFEQATEIVSESIPAGPRSPDRIDVSAILRAAFDGRPP